MKLAEEKKSDQLDSIEGNFQNPSGVLGNSGRDAEYEIDYEEILERIGFGKTQWVLLLMSGFITINSMATQTSVGILAIASQCDFQMNQSEKGIMMASSVTGIFISTYFWGYVSDALGRRWVMVNGSYMTLVLQFLSIFVTNIWVFIVLNFLMGVGLGGVSAGIYAYLSEFNTGKYRAVVINYSTMFVSIAAIYMPATCWLVLSADWSWTIFDGFEFRPWRLIILFNLIPGLIGLLMLLPFPESPKLLMAMNKEEEAVAAVEWVSQFNRALKVCEVLEVQAYRLKPEPMIAEVDIRGKGFNCDILQSIWKATVPLFHKPHRRNFCISAIVVFGLFSSSVGMQIWYPEIVNRSSSNATGTVCDKIDASFQSLNTAEEQDVVCIDTISTKTYVDNIIVGIAFLIGFIIQGALLQPLGKKWVMLVGLSLAVLSGILLHVVTNVHVVVVLFCLYILLSGLSISVMCGAVCELVPTPLRGKAVSISFTLGRLGLMMSTNLIGLLLGPACNTTFAIFTVTIFICGALINFLPI